MQELIDSIHQLVSLTPDERDEIANTFQSLALSKGELWVREGKLCRHIAFVASGKLRVFYYNETGTETTCYFSPQGSYISSFTSFLTETPATENIVAMEDSVLYTISKTELEALSVRIPKLQIWRRVIAENLFIMMEKRISQLQSSSAEERYARVVDENPELILSVPLQYTASFLGITPQHLSRLRKELKK